MAAPGDFAKLVPGFDFLQGLVRNAGAALPGMGQWIAPTLDPDELDKRIDQLRTVQFWLEQNARMIGTTIQALEVQRMTLSTLRGMNLPVADIADAFTIRAPGGPSATAATPPPVPPEPAPAADAAPRPRTPRTAAAPAVAGEGALGGVVDPMKWWSALTDQFAQLAASALKDVQAAGRPTAADAATPSPSRTAASRAGVASAPKAAKASPARKRATAGRGAPASKRARKG